MARYDIDKQPQLNELAPMIVAAQDELSALCNGKRFRMSIPVEDTDSDMVIGDALRHSLAFVRAALGATTGANAVDPPAEGRERGLRATEALSSPTIATPPAPQDARGERILEMED
jgi:hypothetical protein